MTAPVRPTAVGLVLAGGAARRMQPRKARPAADDPPPLVKESLEIGGRSLLDHVVDVVAQETARVIVVTAPGRRLPPLRLPVEVIHDSAPGSGPLAAILDGLRTIESRSPEPFVFVSSCDVPRLRRAVVRLLLARAAESGADWTVPEVAGHPQVLCSVVRPGLAAHIAAWLAGGRRDPRGLLAALVERKAARVRLVAEPEIAVVDPLLESFRDVDTPADRAALEGELPYGAGDAESYTPPS